MKKRPLKKRPILHYVILALLAVVLGVNVYTLNATRFAGNQVPMPFGYGASVVLSGSMEPTLSVGDLLIVREETGYQVGDIVVYQSGTTAVVHRIIAMDAETVTTQGDANNAADEAMPLDAIVGKVIAVIPLVGYTAWVLKSPLGILATAAAAVLLVEFSYRSSKEDKEQEKEALKAEIRQLMKELEKD